MKTASILILTFILIATAALSFCATAKADTACTVTVNDPYSQSYGTKGLQSGGYWVGQIPLSITSGSTFNTLGYCINFDRSISVGTSYPATFASVSDSAEWRAVSYVLTWNNPTTNSEGAAAQDAIWRLLNQTRGTNYFVESWMDPTIDNSGNTLATQAWGKDVVRQGDIFSWISPISGNMTSVPANPGQSVVFTAQLTNSAGTPRPNVRIQFNATLNFNNHATLLNSTHVSPATAYTDSQGRVQVTITVPGDAQLGSSVGVEAATQSVWPQKYIDTTDPSTQDLIGVGSTFQLTVSTNMTLYGFLTVLPENSIGPIAAIGAVTAGFAVWRIKQNKKQVKA